MRLRVLPFALATVLALSIAKTHAGGWAVITLEDLPDQFVVGKATHLTFAVRQHGMRLVPGLSARITAFADGRQVEAVATPGQPGYYSASLLLPRAGQWTITVYSGFGVSALQLMPIAAVPASTPAPPVPAAQRGLALFVAKGCNSCHYHAATSAQPIARVGEDLSNKNYSDALLAKMLTDPSMLPKRDIWEMPNLQLKSHEVSALVAFINKPRTKP